MTTSDLAQAIQRDFHTVVKTMGMTVESDIATSGRGMWKHWEMSYKIQVGGHTLSNKETLVTEEVFVLIKSKPRIMNMEQKVFKSVLGDVGRGLLDIIRKQRG